MMLGRRVVTAKQVLAEGEACPFWYGIAYYEFDRDCRVAYPVPLHLLVRWLRVAWTWIRFGGWTGALDYAYRRGAERGFEMGCADLRRVLDERDEWRTAAREAQGRIAAMDKAWDKLASPEGRRDFLRGRG